MRLLRSVADRSVISRSLGAIAIVIGIGVLSALSPLLLKSLVDSLGTSHTGNAVDSWAAIGPPVATYLLVLLSVRALADIRPLLTGAVAQRLHGRMARRFFDHVSRLPVAYLLKRRSGELLHSLDLASSGAQMMVGHLISSLLPVLVELVTMTVVLLHLGQPRLVLVLALAALAYLIIFSTGARAMSRCARSVSSSSLELYAQLGDGLANFEALRYFAAEEQARRRLHVASDVLQQQWNHLNRLNVSVALAASVTFAASMAACLLISAEAVTRNVMTLGGFVLSIVYALQMVQPLEALGAAAGDLSRALGHLRPLVDLLSEPLAEGATAQCAMPALPARISGQRRAAPVSIENLHFGYDPERPVLKGVDLDVPAGTTTAIVGRSGSGKSSLARLLMRLYSPQQGRILLDGRPIESIGLSELRGGLIGFVPQETALLHATIAVNISMGAPAATRSDIRDVAREARLDAVVDALPLGFDTPVGERGMQLSGGERQRVGIARAMLMKPRIFLLDEPTSMLDGKTEFEIQAKLKALGDDVTVIVIAHRLSTIMHADEIVVLDDGRIQERGTHLALLSRNGSYAQMWRQQAAASP